MNVTEQRENIDSIITYLFIRKLVTPVVKTPAFKLGLVSNSGKVIREPDNEESRMALTILDRITFKIKRLLGGKLSTLNNFLYTVTNGQSYYNKLIVQGSINQRSEIIRLTKDVRKMVESKGYCVDDIMGNLITEEIEKQNLL